MNYRFLGPAVRELREAAKYYEQNVSGLGFEFIDEVRASLRRITSHPEAWASLDSEFRRCRLNRFPYGIIYSIQGNDILIVAVMHLHRRPESWRQNLAQE